MKHAYPVGTCLFLAGPALGQSTASTVDFVKTVAISFAQRMVHDHTQTTEQLKHLVDSGEMKASLPAGLDEQHERMLEKLRAENGADFSKDYNQMQLAGHKEAVALFEAYAKTGDNAALKNWAAKTLPYLQEHLALAEKLSHR